MRYLWEVVEGLYDLFRYCSLATFTAMAILLCFMGLATFSIYSTDFWLDLPPGVINADACQFLNAEIGAGKTRLSLPAGKYFCLETVKIGFSGGEIDLTGAEILTFRGIPFVRFGRYAHDNNFYGGSFSGGGLAMEGVFQEVHWGSKSLTLTPKK